MDRRERRRRKREREKLEKKLKKEASRPAPGGWFLTLRKALTGPRVLWTIVAPGLSLLGAYALLHPHVSVEPSISLNPVDPYSTQFTVKNENHVFDVRNIHCVCWPRKMASGNGFSVVSPGPLANVQHTIPTLDPGSSSTVDCPSIIGGVGAWSGEVLDAELEIVVSYKQSWWPLGITERNAFTAKRDSQRGVHWVHITPAEEKPIFPQR
jgi:hypothetical protein